MALVAVALPGRPAPATAAAQGKIFLSGRVVDDRTGEPIHQFSFQFGRPKPDDPNQYAWASRASSGSPRRDGNFRLGSSGTPGRPMWLRVLAAGYLPQTVTPKPLVPPVRMENLVVRMRRGEAIRGRVVDHKGAAVAKADVFLVAHQTLTVTDDAAVRFAGSRTRTDKDGRFTLTGAGSGPASLVVSAKTLHVWRTAAPAAGRDVTVKLPAPARLVLRYDIPGDLPEATFRLELKTWDMPGWKSVVGSVQNPVAANQGEVILENVAPGPYDLVRSKPLRLGDAGVGGMLDRRSPILEAGKTTRIDFVRKTGQPIAGEVLGLPATKAPGAFVRVRLPASVAAERGVKQWMLPTLDTLTCGRDGRFTTARIPPGEYVVTAQAFEPESPEARFRLGVRGPSFTGRAEVTVRGDVRPPRVLILLKPWSPSMAPPTPPAAAPATPPGPAPRADQLPKLWDALADKDPLRAYHAARAMLRHGDKAVALLEGRLRPAAATPAEIRQRVADLDSKKYAVRRKAMAELYLLHKAAAAALRETLAAEPPEETRSRVGPLLKAAADLAPATPELRRIEAAVRTLELTASPAARRLLKKLAAGLRGAYVTDQAQAALQRIQ